MCVCFSWLPPSQCTPQVVLYLGLRDAARRGHSFAQHVAEYTLCVYDKFGSRHRDIARVTAAAPFDEDGTYVEAARLVCEKSEWRVRALHHHGTAGLKALCQRWMPPPTRRTPLSRGVPVRIEHHVPCALGVRWWAVASSAAQPPGLDVVAVCLTPEGRLCRPIVTDHAPSGPGIFHHGRSRLGTADAAGDRDLLDLHFADMPDTVAQVVVLALLSDGDIAAGATFASVVFIDLRLYTRGGRDPAPKEVAYFAASPALDEETCIELGRFVRPHNGAFSSFVPSGQGDASDYMTMKAQFKDASWAHGCHNAAELVAKKPRVALKKGKKG